MPYVDHHILTPREVYNANHWRRRAKLTLDKVKSVDDPQLKARLVRVATEYQKLARCADGVKAELSAHAGSTHTTQKT
ncbi:hypothetical protein [Afipia felis]|uniref:Uncharacterized protein n=2 Tax=Afipia felis TaxID=1035 RepID=A0A380WC06_AFIFE|nr:hypothetical protein [Afipia felis]EKS29736.1 hypothetical protein HMPREF9697_02264 [Afipia felis ATCC 53690]SUU78443.1 Uncharacterised protein [Afipia felis]SUU86508.1 Uncharacterised protein [Afipia felis]